MLVVAAVPVGCGDDESVAPSIASATLPPTSLDPAASTTSMVPDIGYPFGEPVRYELPSDLPPGEYRLCRVEDGAAVWSAFEVRAGSGADPSRSQRGR